MELHPSIYDLAHVMGWFSELIKDSCKSCRITAGTRRVRKSDVVSDMLSNPGNSAECDSVRMN